jgi:hypothetical protein
VKLKNELCQLLPSSPSTNQHGCHKHGRHFPAPRAIASKLKNPLGYRPKLKNSKISTPHHTLRAYCAISCKAKEQVIPTPIPSFFTIYQSNMAAIFFPKELLPQNSNFSRLRTKTKKFYSGGNWPQNEPKIGGAFCTPPFFEFWARGDKRPDWLWLACNYFYMLGSITSNPAQNNALSASVQVDRSNLPNRAAEPSSQIRLNGPKVLEYFKYFTVSALLGPDDEENTCMFLRNDRIHLPVDTWTFTSNLIHPNRSLQRGQDACAVKIGVYITKLHNKILVFKLWHCVDWQLSEQLASPSSGKSLTTYTPADTLTYPIRL